MSMFWQILIKGKRNSLNKMVSSKKKLQKFSKTNLINENIINISLFVILILIVSVFFAVNKKFLGIQNIMNIFSQSSVIAVGAIGVTMVIITGGIDLSTGSNIALGGAVGAIILTRYGNVFLAISGTILACTIIGLLNGVSIGKFKINPFMMTLGTMSMCRGLTLGLLKANAIIVDNKIFNWLGQGYVGPFPSVAIVVILLYILFNFLIKRHSFGLKLFAVGGNEEAAKASGIVTENIVIYSYMVTGILIGVGSIITVGRLLSAQPWAGLGLEFEIITAVIIGGANLKGGEGNFPGTFLGALITGIISNGMSFLNLSPFYQYIVRGIILISVIYIYNIVRERKSV